MTISGRVEHYSIVLFPKYQFVYINLLCPFVQQHLYSSHLDSAVFSSDSQLGYAPDIDRFSTNHSSLLFPNGLLFCPRSSLLAPHYYWQNNIIFRVFVSHAEGNQWYNDVFFMYYFIRTPYSGGSSSSWSPFTIYHHLHLCWPNAAAAPEMQ